jgi:hypothetical protein
MEDSLTFSLHYIYIYINFKILIFKNRRFNIFFHNSILFLWGKKKKKRRREIEIEIKFSTFLKNNKN